MIINLQGGRAHPPVDTSAPHVIFTANYRLRLTEYGLTVLRAHQEVVLWSTAWPRITHIYYFSPRNVEKISMGTRRTHFDMWRLSDTDADFDYIAELANAYLKAFQGEDNAQQKKSKYPMADRLIGGYAAALVLFNVLLFAGLSWGDSPCFYLAPETSGEMDHLAQLLAAVPFALFILLVVIILPWRRSLMPRYSKKTLGYVAFSLVLGMLLLPVSGLVLIDRGNAMAKLYTEKRGQPFEGTYPVKAKRIVRRDCCSVALFELDTGTPQPLAVTDLQEKLDRVPIGASFHVRGLRSQYGILALQWRQD